MIKKTEKENAIERAIKNLETCPNSRGKTLLLKYYNGEDLTRGQAILAKCAECMGYFVDGRFSCGIEACPLYQFMPYRDKKGK